jgi:hypothetical protein
LRNCFVALALPDQLAVHIKERRVLNLLGRYCITQRHKNVTRWSLRVRHEPQRSPTFVDGLGQIQVGMNNAVLAMSGLWLCHAQQNDQCGTCRRTLAAQLGELANSSCR